MSYLTTMDGMTKKTKLSKLKKTYCAASRSSFLFFLSFFFFLLSLALLNSVFLPFASGLSIWGSELSSWSKELKQSHLLTKLCFYAHISSERCVVSLFGMKLIPFSQLNYCVNWTNFLTYIKTYKRENYYCHCHCHYHYYDEYCYHAK